MCVCIHKFVYPYVVPKVDVFAPLGSARLAPRPSSAGSCYVPVSVNENTPPDKKTGWEISFASQRCYFFQAMDNFTIIFY